MVQSTLIQLLEAGLLPKLTNYLEERLDRSQTGFVPKMGIHVDLNRLLGKITERRKNKKFSSGLFIDFQNAYSSVPLILMFKKLRDKNILDEEEAQIKQLYARYSIRIGQTETGWIQG